MSPTLEEREEWQMIVDGSLEKNRNPLQGLNFRESQSEVNVARIRQ